MSKDKGSRRRNENRAIAKLYRNVAQVTKLAKTNLSMWPIISTKLMTQFPSLTASFAKATGKVASLS